MSTDAKRPPKPILYPTTAAAVPPVPSASLESAEEAVRPLLARANLLRLRGQWEESIAVCTEALRLAPSSASAHALLGDIYDAQGRPDDALPWYQMAVDLDPNNAADRAKFERIRDAQRARLAALAPPASVSPRPAAEKTLEWFDRLFPPGRADGIARLIFAVCGVVALLLLALAAVFYVVLPRDNGTTTTAASHAAESLSLPDDLRRSAPPLVVMHPSVAPRPASLNLTDLRTRLAAALPDAVLAPFAADQTSASENLDLDLTLPAPSIGTSAERLRERVTRTAVQAVRTVTDSASETPHRVTVHIFIRDTVHNAVFTASMPDAPPPAFTGTAPTTAFREGARSASTLSDRDWLSRFERLQWGPFLESGQEAAASVAARGSSQ